jgi:hypothetical protein
MGNALDLYAMSAPFESRPGRRPSWLRSSWFSSILQVKCRNKAKTNSFQFIVRQSSCLSTPYCQRRRKRLLRGSNVMWRHPDIKPQRPRNSPSYGKQPQLHLPTLIFASSFYGIFSQKMRGKIYDKRIVRETAPLGWCIFFLKKTVCVCVCECEEGENVFSSFLSSSEYQLCALFLIKIVSVRQRIGYITFMQQGYINVTLDRKLHHFNYTLYKGCYITARNCIASFNKIIIQQLGIVYFPTKAIVFQCICSNFRQVFVVPAEQSVSVWATNYSRTASLCDWCLFLRQGSLC